MRRPKPTRLKILEGNPGKRRLNLSEPKPPEGIPEMPEHLDDEAQREWNRISAALNSLGLLTTVDRAALAAYCVAWSMWVRAEKEMQQHSIVDMSQGVPRLSPWWSVAKDSLDRMRAFLIEFGLSPASRSRIVGSAKIETDSTQGVKRFLK